MCFQSSWGLGMSCICIQQRLICNVFYPTFTNVFLSNSYHVIYVFSVLVYILYITFLNVLISMNISAQSTLAQWHLIITVERMSGSDPGQQAVSPQITDTDNDSIVHKHDCDKLTTQ